MADYKLTQSGAQVQSLLNSVNGLQSDVSTLETDVSALKTGKASVVIATTVNLPSASWVASGSLYTQAVTINGLLATDTPFCQGICVTTTEAENWSLIINALATANTLTFTATGALSAALAVRVVVIR